MTLCVVDILKKSKSWAKDCDLIRGSTYPQLGQITRFLGRKSPIPPPPPKKKGKKNRIL